MNKIPHIHLEGPMVKAAKALIIENPTGLGWLNKHWALTFDREPSRCVIQAAYNTGLTYHKLGSEVVIALPEVKEYEIDKAVKRFDKFADEYKDLFQKMTSVIYKSINENPQVIRKITASYDLEKMEPGYKGKFLIHAHDAEKAGKHWDIRIEFPVKSLKDSLKKYDKKRPETNEPYDEQPNSSGTVYRSFVDKSREIPTKKNKIYLIETEDHPISYGNFEGEIKGGYGKGTVKIWDKGTYTLVDSDGNKKFVINFQGKKLKGTFALIKYQKGYLWVKTTYEKKASAIDYVRPTLPPQLWDVDKDPPILKDNIRNSIINTYIDTFEKAGLHHPLKWTKGLYLTGSSTTYNYKEDGDVDIDIIYNQKILYKEYPDLKKLTDNDLLNYLKYIIYSKNSKDVANTTHTFSYTVLEPNDKPISDSVYDILKNKWDKKPHSLPMDFDPDEVFIEQKKIAIEITREIDLVIGEIIRTVDDLKKVDQFNNFYGKYNAKRVLLRYKLKNLCKDLDKWYNFIWRLQEEAVEDKKKSFYPAFDFSPNWKEKMIIFKYLARYGYHQCVKMLYSLLKDDPYLEIIDQFIPD